MTTLARLAIRRFPSNIQLTCIRLRVIDDADSAIVCVNYVDSTAFVTGQTIMFEGWRNMR